MNKVADFTSKSSTLSLFKIHFKSQIFISCYDCNFGAHSFPRFFSVHQHAVNKHHLKPEMRVLSISIQAVAAAEPNGKWYCSGASGRGGKGGICSSMD